MPRRQGGDSLDDGLDVLLRNIREVYGWRQTRDSARLLRIRLEMDGWELVPRQTADSGRLYERQMAEVFEKS